MVRAAFGNFDDNGEGGRDQGIVNISVVPRMPADGGAPRPIPGFAADDVIERWAAEAGSLFVRHTQDSGEIQIFRLDATGRRLLVHQIAPIPGSVIGRWFTLTPDGSTWVTTAAVSQSDLYSVTGLK